MWYALTMDIPISLKNLTSQLEMYTLLCDKFNSLVLDTRQLICITESQSKNISQLQQAQTKLEQDNVNLHGQFAVLKDYVDELSLMRDQLQSMIDAGLREITLHVDQIFLAEKNDRIQWQITVEHDNTNWQNETYNDLMLVLKNYQNQINNTNDALYAMQDTIEGDLKKYVDEIFKNYNIYYVVNPITGAVQDINDVLKLLWDMTNRSPTVGQYDALGITVGEYDSYNWTLLQYMRNMHDKMHEIQLTQATTMYNPLSNKYEPVKDVVTMIVTSTLFRWDSISVGDYNNLNETVGNYDTRNITVGDWDSHSKTITGGW